MEREIFHGVNEAGGTAASLCVDVGEDGLLLTSRDYMDEVQVHLSRQDEDRLRKFLVERARGRWRKTETPETLARRNAEIAADYQAGNSCRVIAAKFRLSMQRVHQILVANPEITLRPAHDTRRPFLVERANQAGER